ncbi:MAG: FAD-dependent oxidoreductase [Chloroflexota bacterium]
MAKQPRIVIIGGVAAGPKAAARARRLSAEAEITIVEQGEWVSYGGCGLPFFLSGMVGKIEGLMTTMSGQVRDADFFHDERDITVLTRTRAERIDRQAKVVYVQDLASGESHPLPYDKLVLATGGTATRPPVPGVQLGNVFNLRTPVDGLAIRRLLEERKGAHFTVVGGGLIGLETADALVARGAEVTVLEMADHVLPGLLDPEIATMLERHLEREGLDVRLGTPLQRLEGDEEGNVRLVVAGDEEIETAGVIVGTGLRPNVGLAREAGLEIGVTGAIVVDDFLRTSDPDIYAGGDCVELTHHLGDWRVCFPLGTVANKHGRIIGGNVLGGQERFGGVLGTMALQVLEFNVARTGLTEAQGRKMGYDVVTALVPTMDTAHFHPLHAPITVKLVADRATRRLLGAQVVGTGESVKRVDVAAVALSMNATVDQLADADLSYAPPFASAIDAVAHAANLCRDKIDGLASSWSVAELRERLAAGEPLALVDVRTPAEAKQAPNFGLPLLRIPLGELRRRLAEVPADRQVVAICALGTRSYEAQRLLRGAGLDTARFLEGGIAAWTGR